LNDTVVVVIGSSDVIGGLNGVDSVDGSFIILVVAVSGGSNDPGVVVDGSSDVIGGPNVVESVDVDGSYFKEVVVDCLLVDSIGSNDTVVVDDTFSDVIVVIGYVKPGSGVVVYVTYSIE